VVDKYDRHGYKNRKRILFITNERFYGIDAETMKLRDNIANRYVTGLSLSKYADGVIVVHVKVFEKQADASDKTFYKRVSKINMEILYNL
jgi:myosin-1